MPFSLLPWRKFRRLTDVRPDFLLRNGISFLMLDLDNTISPYGDSVPGEDVLRWADDMREKGVTLCIVSNNKTDRPVRFAGMMGIASFGRARKPRRNGILAALEAAGKKPDESALAGDQIYTDVLAANLCGAFPILVQPVRLEKPLHIARYVLEIPFRREKRRIIGKEQTDGIHR